MKRIPLGRYAKLHKLSRAQVIQKILRGELEAEEVVEDGKKVRYILINEEPKELASSSPLPPPIAALVSKVVDLGQLQRCFEGSDAYYLLFADRLLVVDKESGILRTIKECKERS